MKIQNSLSAIKTWLYLAFIISTLAGVTIRAYAGGHKIKHEGEKGISGDYVVDPVVSVPANAYTTFSTVYNGKRYYLGVDTVRAKLGKDTVCAYEQPCYAAMWIAGPLWSSTGEILPNKDYTRTVKSVWLSERVSRTRYLALGSETGSYKSFLLRAEGAMWHTEKDSREQNQYINGYMYCTVTLSGLDENFYLTYDPVYGFSRAFLAKPSASQRISVWDRKTGSDVVLHVEPANHTFGMNTTQDTVKLPIRAQAWYFPNIDRFRSRVDQSDIYTFAPDTIKDQATLANPEGEYKMYAYYEWSSHPLENPADPSAYNGNSYVPYYSAQINYNGFPEDETKWTLDSLWKDSLQFHMNYRKFYLDGGWWHDTIYAIGRSPFDNPRPLPEGGKRFLAKPAGGGEPTEGTYTNHKDWLHVYFNIKGINYVDSAYVIRQIFHYKPYTTLTSDAEPADHEFPYTYNDKRSDETTNVVVADTAYSFTITAEYVTGANILNATGLVVESPAPSEKRNLDLTKQVTYIDTTDAEHPIIYDSLLIEALNIDGTPCSWAHPRLTARNTIRVKVDQYDPEAMVDRKAQIRYTYRYRHSSAEGDWAVVTRSIWITQLWKNSGAAGYYSFNHKDVGANGLQEVHEKSHVYYGIPGEDVDLPLNRDHWGYYRWFNYDNDHDVRFTSGWNYGAGDAPKNQLDGDFIMINGYTSAASRGRFEVIRDIQANPLYATDHFTFMSTTESPAVHYPLSSTEKMKIACDVSAYYNINTHDSLIGKLKELTEPTLSYRNIFDIRPAKESADKMRECRVGEAGHNGWMLSRTVLVPANRAFRLYPQNAISTKGSSSGTGATTTTYPYKISDLQYIYYFNPDAVGSEDSNMGIKKDGVSNASADCYARIGLKYKSGKTKRKAKLLTAAEALAVTASGKKVVLVNALKDNAFVLGRSDDGSSFTPYGIGSITDTAQVRQWIEDNVLNPEQTKYILKLKKNGDDAYAIEHVSSGDEITLSGSVFGINGLGWNDNYILGDETNKITMGAYTGAASTAINSKYSANLVWLHLYLRYQIIAWHTRQGYLTGSDWKEDYYWEGWSRVWYHYYVNKVQYSEEPVGDAANQAWLFYEIEEPVDVWHYETPAWYVDGVKVAHWDYNTENPNNDGKGVSVTDVAGYSITADGGLEVPSDIFTAANQSKVFELKTEHFQLLKATVYSRSEVTEGPSQSTIISEEDIQSNYEIIWKMPMEDFPAPGTSSVVAYNEHLPWDMTELSYHYPLAASGFDHHRVVDTLETPQKGEYCFLNKYVVPWGPNTANRGEEFECRAGAQYGYMMVVNAAPRRCKIIKFEYPQFPCSNQQLYLVGEICNPVQNGWHPELTMDMEGIKDGDTTLIYRYKSGKIEYQADPSKRWYQFALPIDPNTIKSYEKFICSATMNGGSNVNATLLVDRLRFVEKSRAFSVFQNKATCIKDDSVTVLIRLNYQSDPDLYKPGKLVAYQFQKHTPSGYVPMIASRNNGDGTYTAYGLDDSNLEVYPGYLKDAFTTTESVEKPFLKSSAGNDYGYVMIPALDYDPSASNVPAGQSNHRADLIDQALDSLGITGAAAADRKAKFLNETNNIRTFDQIVAHDYNDFVTISFGDIKTPHIKSFVNVDGTWLLYIVCRLPVTKTDNNTFRIGMTVMNSLKDKPTFTEENCATFHVMNVKQTTSLLLDGEAWPNKSRAVLEAHVLPEDTLLAENETYRASIKLTVTDKVGIHLTKNPRCKFDLLHAADSVRDIHSAADSIAFVRRYGCNRTQFVDDMEAFRTDDERNVMRDITDWSEVTPEMFTRTGRTMEVATGIYNRLNHLVEMGVLELGLDYRDIYMGDKADSYFYLLPIPATGKFEVEDGVAPGVDSTWQASVCNDTLWLQLHSKEPQYFLRYGYDSRVGDTFIVPVVRASKTDANSSLKVRLAEITNDGSKAAVLGWQSTKLVETNDTSWHAAVPAEAFIYQQNKDTRNKTISGYYTKGDTVVFTPKAGTTFQLKAGYWYRFKSTVFGAVPSETYPAADPDESYNVGHSYFILAVAPDTIRWTPGHADGANYWNDDHNWTPVMASTPADGFKARVPMGDTKVIIPAVDKGKLPIVADIVGERMDTLHFGYAKNTCKEILFQPRSQILGQEKLDYKKAFVDVLLTTGSWQTFSPALEHINSGDMYIPSNLSTDKDFLPGTFPAGAGFSGAKNPRVWPYAFYQGFYNSAVRVAYQNSDETGHPVSYTTQRSKNTVDWVRSNALDIQYKPGAASMIKGYDESDEDGHEIVVRLPKQEASYYGFGKSGSTYIATTTAITMLDTLGNPRPAFAALEHNLAYDSTTLKKSGGEGIAYTLTNEIASEIFFFGNPTMSLIDVYTLCKDNAGVLQHEDGTYHFTAYQLIDGSNYTVKDITAPGQYFVAPMRTVGLVANSARNTLSIVLKPDAIVAITGDGTIVSHDDVRGGAPKRRALKADEIEQEQTRRLYITASNETDDGLTKAYLVLGEKENAQRGFRKGEDALCLTSGLNYFSYSSYSTPLSMYTIADNQALMMDIRDTLSSVPVVFTTLSEKYDFSDFTTLSFTIEGAWETPLYLYDALTNDSIMIRNGLQVAIRTPESDQIRYFINGRHLPKQTEDTNIATGVDNIGGNEPSTLNTQHSTFIYDILGRRVMVLGEHDLISNVQLPTGVYIIQRGNKTERMVIR